MTELTRQEKRGRYDHAAVEARWQRFWEERGTFRTPNPGEPGFDASRPKCYILDMFPYPSGAGLHVGHPVGYCATDIFARYKRMRGFNVLHPMGFDAFGLPAEQYAIETNVHPAVTTKKNIEMYRRQLKMFGFSYDWSRELATCDPPYYRFTQWMFKQMFESWYDEECRWLGPDGKEVVGRARPISELVAALEAGRFGIDASLKIVRDGKGRGRRNWSELAPAERRQALDKRRLAYIDEIPVSWCPALGTVLANEEVDNDCRSERGGHPVFRRPLRQWILRISAYAERLLSDLPDLDWPEPIKLMQRNWVGRSTGAEIVFPLADKWRAADGLWVCNDPGVKQPLSIDHHPHAIKVYTTRPDTLFGATYMVLAPEHPLVEQVTTPPCRADVDQYIEAARCKTDMARTADAKEKTGVFTGAYALNPVNGERIPIWIADYVLMGYGTGAIMAVPGGDTRDYEFARAFDLPIIAVVKPPTEWIEERVSVMAEGLDQKAAAECERVAREQPEFADEVAQVRARTANLSAKTIETLRKNVGPDRLAEHYVQHPESWGAAFIGEGVAVNSPANANGDTTSANGATTSAFDFPSCQGGMKGGLPGGVCDLNGLPTPQAKEKITRWLEQTGVGRGAVNYKLRDWLFSRQRYWGEPFPVLHGEDGETISVDDAKLPVELPEMEDFRPTPSAETADSLPEPPLARAKHWMRVERNGSTWSRDANTMPQWAGSCWYYLRFIDPHNTGRFCDPAAENYWMSIDLYVGGAEHAVLHLLYARFWHKVLYDLGHVSTREPFRKLFNQGMIQGFAYRDRRGMTLGPDAVEEHGHEQFVARATGEPVTRIIAKMSKSLKNVVNPDQVISEYGADTFRLYEMYMGPLDSAKPWNTRDVPGLYKLCQRIWRLFIDEQTDELSPALTDAEPDDASLRALHKMIKRVTDDIEHLKFNTAIAAIFDCVNTLTPMATRSRKVLEPFVLVLAPFTPHLAEELWSRLGRVESLAYTPWPAHDERLTRDERVEIAVQINGKVKSRIFVPADADEAAMRHAAMADEKIAAALGEKPPKKIIVVKGRLVNLLV